VGLCEMGRESSLLIPHPQAVEECKGKQSEGYEA
jgi:hypothetical protein